MNSIKEHMYKHYSIQVLNKESGILSNGRKPNCKPNTRYADWSLFCLVENYNQGLSVGKEWKRYLDKGKRGTQRNVSKEI